MRFKAMAMGACVVMTTTSCGGGGVSVFPTGQEINNSLANTLEDTVRSVAGDWVGIANVPNTLRLEFRLQEGSNGQVSGTGTMREDANASAVPITITGTYLRPTLTLNFAGMVVDARQVQAGTQGGYNSIGGIATTLTLTAPGYTREIAILLQEK